MRNALPLVLAAALAAASPAAVAAPSPVDANGRLRTEGARIVNERGAPLQLRGVCTHGLQWFGDFYRNGRAIEAAATLWGADVIRVAVYVYEGGYLDHATLRPADFDAMIDGIVHACLAAGVYCILDWHVHHPGDPAFYSEAARDFFDRTARRYGGLPHVIYEIANEPNRTGLEGVAEGCDVRWGDVADYADEVIPVIRRHAPDALVLVGTPAWSSFGISDGRDPGEVADRPLRHSNVAYVLHFYAAGHGFHERIDAVAGTLPVFATEWAAASWSNNSTNDPAKARPWLEVLNRRMIGWTYWNFAPGDSVFSVFDKSTGPDGPFLPTGTNVTETGRLLHVLLNDPPDAWARP